MTIFDEYLKENVEVQTEITPDIGKEIQLTDPDEFKEVFAEEDQ